MELVFGGMVTVLALFCVFIGLPMQIRLNVRLRRCAQPGLAIKLGLALLLCRHVYLPLRGEWMLLIPETCALILNCVLFTQYMLYPGLEPRHGDEQAAEPAQPEAPRNRRRPRRKKRREKALVA